MKEFISIICGPGTIPQFLAALFFAYITAFAMLMIRTTTRNVLSSRTPIHFDWSFFVSDNMKRILGNVILISLAVRFLREYIGPDWTVYAGLLIGLVSHVIAPLFILLSDTVVNKAKDFIKNLFKPNA